MNSEQAGRQAGRSDHVSHPDPIAVLDDLARRRGLVTVVIRQLAAFYGLDPAPWLDDTRGPNGETIQPARGTKNEERRTKRPKGDTSRPPDAPSQQGDRILTALKAHGSPMSPGELATKLKVDRSLCRYHVKLLEKQGLVTSSGTTASRRIALS